MSSLLNIVEKLQYRKDFLLNTEDLPEKLINKLLKWYDGNPYNKSDKRIKEAFHILLWCYDKSDLDYLPREMREKRFEAAAQALNISYEKLVKLFSSHTKVLFPAQKETKIIAVEGIDGSGKTVQMSLLEEQLKAKDKQTIIKSFPVYDSFFGKNIGQFLSGNEEVNANDVDPKSMSLWYALDRWKEFEKFNFVNYDYLLLNRFTLSSAVYQSSRVKPELREEFIQWIFELEHSQLGLPSPDLYIVFDLNTETSKKNVSNKGFRDYVGEKADVYEESTDIMRNARGIYQELAKKYNNIVIINCLDEDNKMKTPEEINQIVMKVIEDGEY
ncbi:thymidylate kinase [Bacillus cereus]|nr:thymidylate kinase [Bacillus cereus]